MQSSNMGVGGGNGHQSFHDMQRLQQQLVYRQQQQQQQQVGAMGSLGTQQAMPQQPSFPTPGLVQQHLNTNSLAALQQQHTMNNNSALSMMQGQQQQQQSLGVGMSSGNINQLQFNGGGSVSNSWNPTGSGLGQGLAGSTMDASSGTSARLMAIAGMGGNSSGLMSSGSAGMNSSSSFGNNVGLGGNGVLSSNSPGSASTMQNMQVLLQRQQHQQNMGKQLPVESSNLLASNFGTPQQQQHNTMFNNNGAALANKLQQQQNNMGVSGMNGSIPNPSIAQIPGNLYPLQQQQFLLQQQLAAMQKQQGRNSGLGGTSGSASIQSGQHQQQDSGLVSSNNSLNGIGGTNGAGANQNLLQQRQQQLLNQIQQGNQSQGSNSSVGMMSQLQHQQQQGAGNSGMLQQIMSNFRQQLQSDVGDKNNGSANTGTSGVMMNQMNGLGSASNLNRSSSATPTMLNANQDLNSNQMQQQHSQLLQSQSNLNSGANTIGLGLNNLSSEQRFRLQQQSLMGHGSVGSSGVFGVTNSGNTGELGLALGQHNDVLGELPSSSLQLGQSGSHSPFPGPIGGTANEATSGQNTPMLGPGGVSSTGMTSSAILDQGNSQRSIGNGTSVQSSSSSGGSNGQQRSFLDGMFAGGWQSNKDLPDRRRIIFNILDVIRQMRPDTSKMSDKLPHMAKSLEEHLYRNSKSKEEYMDLATLKKRLQTIAHGLEVHREGPNLTGMKHSESSGSEQTMLLHGNDCNTLHAAFDIGSVGGGSGGDTLLHQGNSNWNQLQNAFSGLNPLGTSSNSSAPMANLGMNSGTLSGSNALMGSLQMNQSEQGMSNNSTNQQTNPQTSIAGSMNQQLQMHGSRNGGQNGAWSNVGNLGAFNQEVPKPQLDQLSRMISNQSNMNNTMGFQQQNLGAGGGLFDTSIGSQFSNNASTQNSNLQNASNSLDIPGMSQQSQGGQSLRNISETSWGNPSEIGNTTSMDNVDGSGVTNQAPSDSGVQKKRVILQQQQRLLLLRHASRCTAGPNCATKFCEQMVTLWNHMKTCRNKNCKTSHCFSSRCVLNHYRICKSNGKTASCEVCGPVMLKIKQQERDDGGSTDPLAAVSSSQIQFPMHDEKGTADDILSSSPQNFSSGLSDNEDAGKNQQKMKAQLLNLRLLLRKQEELQKQQQRLDEQLQNGDPNSQQGQQLQQQQMLLQQLRKRCQQQQMVLQQSIQKQSSTSNETDAEPMPTTSTEASVDVAPEAVDDDDNDDNSNTVQTAKPSGSIGEGKGKRIASKGKRGGKQLSKAKPEKEKEDDPGKKRRASATITPKERAQKRGKLASKQAAMIQRGNDGSSQTGKEQQNAENGEGDANSVLSNMTKEDIQKHLESLNKKTVLSSSTVTLKCMSLIQELLNNPNSWVFREAVDPVVLGLPDYFEVVKNPMHLELVKNKLENAAYSDMEHFAHDTKLVFENAILYNGKSSEVGEMAQSMLDSFDKSFNALVQGKPEKSNSALVQEVENSYIKLESQGDLCPLCGLQRRQFEPTVLYCQGKCGMQKIMQDAIYYTDRTKQNHWCESCYSLAKAADPFDLDDGTKIFKKDLQEFKNDAVAEEGWVNCDQCNSWVHQICGLFNGRTNNSNATYTCPKCYNKHAQDWIENRKQESRMNGARELPHCKMSQVIERGLFDALEAAYTDRATELKVPYDEIEKAEGLAVRVVSSVEKTHVVGEKMLNRYMNSNCATEFPVKTKCISLFQRIHGVDTILFAVYVYEYGQDCPAPNRRRVYISYLDSAKYFVPKCFRTIAYHSIMIEYLRYVKNRGFHTAHIWSSPPTPGDDFIFYCHPKYQLVPREDMLRNWYLKMLEKAKSQGIVIQTSTLYDEYFSDIYNRLPTCLPYFEGDYIPGEIENIIGFLQSNPGKGKSSSSIDEVMKRTGSNLAKMKENFIVIHLRSRGFAAAVERGEDVLNWKEDGGDGMVRSNRTRSQPHEKLSDKEFNGRTPHDEYLDSESVRSTYTTRNRRPSVSSVNTRSKTRSVKADRVSSDIVVQPQLEVDSERSNFLYDAFSEASAVVSSNSEGRKSGRVSIGDTSDEDPLVESEIFESRQQLLNYCQTNNCQFDELRRAKHSTIMLLYQLHNPMAPRFLHQCGACYLDITHGFRYHCNVCVNFDLCADCYNPVISGEWAKKDQRFAHDKSHVFEAIDLEAKADTRKSREERDKCLKAHVALLEHASKCDGLSSCTLVNCQRLKKILLHVSSCDTTPKRDCKICTRILLLCTVHSRLCNSRTFCAVPFCDRLRERSMRLRQQQQLMDDRRRNAQNHLYHAAAGKS